MTTSRCILGLQATLALLSPQKLYNKKIIVALQEGRLRHGGVEQLAPGHMAQESPPDASINMPQSGER